MLTQVGLDTFVDPRRQGGRMNRRTVEEVVQVVEFDGQEWLYLRSLRPDVASIRATTADERGNLSFEQEGAFLGVYDVALAAHNSGGIVIAQVKRLAAGRQSARPICACPRYPGGSHCPGPGTAPDHPDRLRPGHQRRSAHPRRRLRGRGMGHRKDHCPPGRRWNCEMARL